MAASRKTDMASVTFLSIGEHFWWKNNAQLQPLGADLCSIFGFEQMICSLPGLGVLASTVLGVGAGGGRPSHHGGRCITTGKIWISYIRNHAFSCVFA